MFLFGCPRGGNYINNAGWDIVVELNFDAALDVVVQNHLISCGKTTKNMYNIGKHQIASDKLPSSPYGLTGTVGWVSAPALLSRLPCVHFPSFEWSRPGKVPQSARLRWLFAWRVPNSCSTILLWMLQVKSCQVHLSTPHLRHFFVSPWTMSKGS